MNTSSSAPWSACGADRAGTPAFLTAAHRWLPPAPVPEILFSLLFGAVAAARHGLVWGAAAALMEAAILGGVRRSPAFGIAMLAVAFALPRLETSQDAPFFLRPEDFVIAALCLEGLRRPGSFLPTPMDGAFALYASVLAATTLAGLALGTVASPLQAVFTLLKQVELLLVFFAAAGALRTARDRRGIADAFLVSVLFLGAVAAVSLVLDPDHRPFNRTPYLGESNHIGAYAAVAAALFVSRRDPPRARWILGAVASLLLIVATESRTAMLGLTAVLLFLTFVRRSKAAAALLAGGILCVLLVPGLSRRIGEATTEWEVFRNTEERVRQGFPPSFSYNRNRFEVWALLVDEYRRFPLTGTGPGSRHRVLYENQYFMTLCESGLAGIAALGFLVWSAVRGLRRRRSAESAAAGAALCGTLAMGLTSISLTISRCAGLWWILMGMALASDDQPTEAPEPPAA